MIGSEAFEAFENAQTEETGGHLRSGNASKASIIGLKSVIPCNLHRMKSGYRIVMLPNPPLRRSIYTWR
jgi:hypothetical protein